MKTKQNYACPTPKRDLSQQESTDLFPNCYKHRQTDNHIRTVPQEKMGSFLPLSNRVAFTEFSSYWSYMTEGRVFFSVKIAMQCDLTEDRPQMQFLQKIRLAILDLDRAPCTSRRNFRYYMLILKGVFAIPSSFV